MNAMNDSFDGLSPMQQAFVEAAKKVNFQNTTDNTMTTEETQLDQSVDSNQQVSDDVDSTNEAAMLVEESENQDTQDCTQLPVEGDDESYPDPEEVNKNVEERLKPPGKKNKNNNKAEVKRPVLFGLSPDREAGLLLKNIFDVSTIEGVDGVNHINIHSEADTALGRALDISTRVSLNHPELGQFKSVGGIWQYVQTRPLVEEYRTLYGSKLRAKTNRLRADSIHDEDAPRQISVKGFRTIIADAMWHRVTQDNVIVDAMCDSELPFEYYYVQGEVGIRRYPSEGFWVIAAYEEIRRVIKLRLLDGQVDEQPDFTHIEKMSNPNVDRNKRQYSDRNDDRRGTGYKNNRSYFGTR